MFDFDNQYHITITCIWRHVFLTNVCTHVLMSLKFEKSKWDCHSSHWKHVQGSILKQGTANIYTWKRTFNIYFCVIIYGSSKGFFYSHSGCNHTNKVTTKYGIWIKEMLCNVTTKYGIWIKEMLCNARLSQSKTKPKAICSVLFLYRNVKSHLKSKPPGNSFAHNLFHRCLIILNFVQNTTM